MLDLNDKKWKTFNGGYRTLYDVSILLKELEFNPGAKRTQEIMNEFWQELHHQGDVDLASYYCLPHLIRIGIKNQLKGYDIPGLVAAIETQRHANNPQLPKEDLEQYKREIKEVTRLISLNQEEDWKRNYASSATAAIAAVNGQIDLAKIILELADIDISSKLKFLMENFEEIEELFERKNSN